MEAGRVECAAEHRTSRTDKGPPRPVLDVARLLADEHHGGPARLALPEDGLRRTREEVTPLATSRRSAQSGDAVNIAR
jgi:hypothetical protein